MAAETRTARFRSRFRSIGAERPPPSGAALVTIHAGARSNLPLFCVHAEAGDVSLYFGIARHLPGDRPVLGLVAPAPGELGPAMRMEDLAERHVREIRGAQPDGPYLILGECTGGALAYEIARQLGDAGQQIALLALVDAFAPGLPRLRRPMPRALYRTIHRARILGFHLHNLARLDMRGRAAYATAKARRARTALTARASAARGRSTPGASQRLAFRRALAAYVPEPCGGSMLLLRADRLPLGIEAAPDMGWGALVESLRVETLPGYFTTPISEPGVRTLADRLAAHLADACGRAQGR